MTGRNDWHELQGCGGEIEEASFDGGMEIASLYGAYANDTRRRRERERVSERYTYSLYDLRIRVSGSRALSFMKIHTSPDRKGALSDES